MTICVDWCKEAEHADRDEGRSRGGGSPPPMNPVAPVTKTEPGYSALIGRRGMSCADLPQGVIARGHVRCANARVVIRGRGGQRPGGKSLRVQPEICVNLGARCTETPTFAVLPMGPLRRGSLTTPDHSTRQSTSSGRSARRLRARKAHGAFPLNGIGLQISALANTLAPQVANWQPPASSTRPSSSRANAAP